MSGERGGTGGRFDGFFDCVILITLGFVRLFFFGVFVGIVEIDSLCCDLVGIGVDQVSIFFKRFGK